MWCQLMGRIYLPANFCDYFLISPTAAPEGKKAVSASASKVRRQKYWPMKFCEPTTTSVCQRKKRIWTASCLVQIKLPEPLLERGRREGGRWRGKEGGREKPSYKFATVIQIQTLDKHIHPIMLRLFVTIGTFFLLFIRQLEKLHQFKFNLRVFFLKTKNLVKICTSD